MSFEGLITPDRVALHSSLVGLAEGPFPPDPEVVAEAASHVLPVVELSRGSVAAEVIIDGVRPVTLRTHLHGIVAHGHRTGWAPLESAPDPTANTFVSDLEPKMAMVAEAALSLAQRQQGGRNG